MHDPRRVFVLGVDGGLLHVGLCVAELQPGFVLRPVFLDVVTAKRAKAPKAVRDRIAEQKRVERNARARERSRRARAGEPPPAPIPPPLTGTTGGFPAEDTASRVRVHVAALRDVLRAYPISAVCVEALSLPRNASGAAKIAATWGAAVAVAHLEGLPLVQAAPQAVKFACTGDPSAEKGRVGTALIRLYPDGERLIAHVKNAGDHDHAWDALGVIHACRDVPALSACWPLL